MLPLTLGAENLRKIVMTMFTVVSAPSSYNVILRRPAMNALITVASTYHQKIEFPVWDKVKEVQGDQPSSRKCYVETVREITRGPREIVIRGRERKRCKWSRKYTQ